MSDEPTGGDFNQVERYEALMEVIRDRHTNRAFVSDYEVPREHYEMILEAARHSPSGANSQPWHYVVVTDPEVKEGLAARFREEQRERARLKMRFPTPDYSGMAGAPGLVLVIADFRFVRAFPMLGDDSDLDRLYKRNAERILLQSVAASVLSAHLAAAALGYAVWWVTAIGQEGIQHEFKPLLGVPDELEIIDIMCFGPPLKPSYTRWKKTLDEIVHWDRFDASRHWSEADIDEWIAKRRHKVMYRDETKVD